MLILHGLEFSITKQKTLDIIFKYLEQTLK